MGLDKERRHKRVEAQQSATLVSAYVSNPNCGYHIFIDIYQLAFSTNSIQDDLPPISADGDNLSFLLPLR